MVLTKFLTIKVNRNTFEYYKNLGYKIEKIFSIIIIPIEHLTKGSKYKINALCSICGFNKEMMYKTYNQMTENGQTPYFCNKCKHIKTTISNNKKYGTDYIFQSEKFKLQVKNYYLEKYQVENCMQLEGVKNKQKETMMKKYNVENIFQLESVKVFLASIKNESQQKIKETKIKNGTQISDELLEDFFLYKKNVKNDTNKKRVKLFKLWNGYDFYDNEFIKNNISLYYNDDNYPTIDHKISIIYGFINNIPFEEISSFSNLCITKRIINSIKNYKTIDIFLKN